MLIYLLWKNAQYLSYSSSLQKWINTNITEPNVTNLVNDLLSCEKLANKNTSNGYCGSNNGLINIANIPDLPESFITNLTLDLSNKYYFWLFKIFRNFIISSVNYKLCYNIK